MYTAIRAKKASYGYKCYVGRPDDLIAAAAGVTKAKSIGITHIEWDSNMGRSEVRLYTDDVVLATSFALACANGEVLEPKAPTKKKDNTI